jgi:hypothetical protein
VSDGQASRGQLPYLPSRCVCHCLITLHKLDDNGQRAACTNSNCPCKRFVAEEVANA